MEDPVMKILAAYGAAHKDLQDQVQKLADATLALTNRVAKLSAQVAEIEYRTGRRSTSAKP